MSRLISRWKPLFPASGVLTSPYHHLSYLLLQGKTILIGRSPVCDYIPPESFSDIDMVQCSIRTCTSPDGRSFAISARSHSGNGTFVNNARISHEDWTLLTGGDVLQFGGVSRDHLSLHLRVYAPMSIESEFDNLGRVGGGGYGTVDKYQSRLVGGVYAVKTVSTTPPADDRDRVPDELETLTTLEHPNIVKLFGFLSDSKNYYFIMELAPHGSVQSLIKEIGSLTNEVARTITEQTCAALKYMHETYGIVHRDIKPPNVLVFKVNPVTRVKLADFGLSRVITGNTVQQSAVGSPHFVAPEILDIKFMLRARLRPRHYDVKVDSWSLGVMVFTMLSGQNPFPQAELLQTLAGDTDHRTLDYSRLPVNASPLARDLIMRLTADKPANRTTAAEALLHPWITSTPQSASSTSSNVYS